MLLFILEQVKLKKKIKMKQFNNLYARDSKGSINTWEVVVNNQLTYSLIIIGEGLMDGKKTITSRQISKGKNIGKMNATTPYEQACSEAEARWTKKKKQGYKSLEDLGIECVSDLNENLNGE